MPLPAPNSAWPPKPYDQVLAACQERQVWWEGDPDKLAAFYGGQVADRVAQGRSRFGRAWDAFWGKQIVGTSQPKRLHVPVAADIGRIGASTLLSEPVTFSDPAGDAKLTDRIDTILNTPETYSRMLVAGESAAMLSGAFGRIVWDTTVDQHTWIDWVDTDRVIPVFRWGKLAEATFWTELNTTVDDRVVWRHLEHHSVGLIEHALYCGTADSLGSRVDLKEHSATAALQNQVPTSIKVLTAGYFPWKRPNPQWRNTPQLKDFGRSDLTRDVLHLLDAMDRCWSSWMNDLEIGRGRVIISEQLLTSRGAGRGAGFDLEQSLYSPVGAAVTNGDMTTVMEAHQFAIRVDEHERTFHALLRQTVSRVGYSPITFGLQDEVAATATEVDAKERDTNSTRGAQINLWHAINDLATAQLAIDAAVFKQSPAPTETITVDWPAAHQQSERQRAETVQLWEAASAATADTKVRYLHPDWDEQRIADEVAGLLDQAAAPVSIVGPNEADFAAAVEPGNTDTTA